MRINIRQIAERLALGKPNCIDGTRAKKNSISQLMQHQKLNQNEKLISI